MRNLFTQLFSFGEQAWSEKDQVKNGAGLAGCSWGQIGTMLEEGAIEHPLSTLSAPFGTRRKPAGDKTATPFGILRLAAMVTLLLTFACGNVWGDDRGFWDSGAGSVRFYRNGSSEYWANVNKNGVSDFSLGNIDSDGGLIWTDAWAKVWGGNNIFNSITLYWRVKGQDAGSGPSYSNYNLNWNKNLDGNNQYWEVTMQSQTCSTTGLAAGNYEVEFYWTGAGKDGKTYYLSNNGGNYHANFTLRRKITYHTDGKTSGDAPATEWFSGAATVRDNTGLLQKTGYVFAGWADSKSRADAGTIDHEPGTSSMSVTLTANLDLYPVWKPGYYLISLAGSGNAGTKDGTNFTAARTLTNGEYEVNGVKFSNNHYNFSSGTNSYGVAYDANKHILYDTKTDNEDLFIYAKSTSGSQNLYYTVIKDGLSCSEETLSVSTSGVVKKIPIAHSKSSRVVISTASTNIKITNIKVVKHGSALPAPCTAGYQLSFPGRPGTGKTTAYTIDGITLYSKADLKFGTGSMKLSSTSTTEYIQFAPSTAIQLQVKISANKHFSVCTNRSSAANVTATGEVFGGTTGTTYNINLSSAGTYYIVGNDGDLTIDKIAFANHVAYTAPTGLAASSITSSGATLTVTDGSTRNYEFYVSTSSTAPTASSVATHSVTGSKTYALTGLTASTNYYVWVRAVETKFNKSSWVALTGSYFTTSGAATYDVSVTVNPSGYGTLSASSIEDVVSGTSISASSNVLTVGESSITATAADATDEYTYAFSNWTKSDGTALPSTVTADLSVYANFTRTANSYDVTLTYDDDQVSKESGSVGSDAATYGTNYVATFEAESGYELQSDVAVTIGESTATKGTEYTWAISDGVGTLTILGSYITGDIEVTVEADVLCTDVDAPTSLACSAQTPTTLTYTWTKAANASGYTASLWDNSSCTGDAVSTQNLGDVATVTFTSLSASTTYYCKVQSKGDGSTYCTNGGETSAQSGETTCTELSLSWIYPFSQIEVGITPSNPISGNSGSGAITYSSSAPSKIEIMDNSQKLPRATAAGSATITASVAATGVYCSGSVTSGTITVVASQSGLITQALPTGNVAWDNGGGPAAPTTTDGTNITSTTAIAASGMTISTSSNNGNTTNGGQTAKIPSQSSYDKDKYVSLGFTIKSGKKLAVSAIYIPVQPVTSNTGSFKAVLSDGTTDIEGTVSNIPNGRLDYIRFPSLGTVTGNVTLKIWAWGHTNGYRLGRNIIIDGEIQDDCDAITAEGGTGTATSITKTGASLPYTLTNTTGVASVTIKVYDSEDNLVETIAGLSAAASGSGSATSLSAGTTYYYTVTPIASSGYCDGEESDPSDEFTTKYGVTYAAGVTLTSGSVPTDANAYDEGDDATVLGNTGSMVYTGYTFRGWTYNGTFYLAGQSIEISGNITLTAAWDSGSGECNTTLVDIDFTNKGSSTSYSAGSTYTLDGTSVYFKSAMSTYSDGTYLNLPGNATTSSNYMAVPLSSINGSITITVTHNSTRPQWKHYLAEKSATPSSSDLSTAPSSMSDCPRPGSNTTTTTWTISNISKSYGVFYVGKGSNGTSQFMGLTITTPCAGSSFTVTFADGNTAPASHTTWPDDIEGVPSGKKILQPADPTADDYVFGGWYIDAACTNAFNFSGTITKDTTLYAKWSALHTVTWMVNGSEYTTGDPTTETEGSITTVPTAPSAITCSDSFRGWSATNLYGEAVATPPADLFVTAADAPAITENTIFYAIFGDAVSESATNFTSTFTSKSWADSGSKWNSGKDGTNLTSGRGIQVSTTTTGANATTKAEYKAVTSVVVTYSTNASSGAGSIEIKVGGTEMSGSAAVTKEGGESDRTITYTPVFPATSLDGKVQIIVNCTTNSIYIKSVQISHSGTFENYRCICPTMTVTPKLVTARTPIFITSAADKTVRSQDSLVIVGSGLSKSTAITLSSPASKFELRSRTNGVISTDATGSIDTVAYIYYTPGAGDTSDGLDKNANFTVSVAGNGAIDVPVSQALIGRHVPANFVIAAKSGDNWYALPADMSSTSTPTPVEIIAVDNESDPTTARTPEENVYSLYPPTNNNITSGNGQYIRLGMHGVAKEGSLPAPLFGSATGTYTLGKSGTSVITNDLPSGGWWWKLQQTNTSVTDSKYATYNLYGANNTNSLKIYTGPKWGLYASGVDEIRLIPWLANYRVFFEDGNLTPASHTTWPDNIESVLSGETIDEPTDEPEADGYVFIGWYKEAECTNAWNFATDVITEATTLYAKWTGSDYNITYHLNGASWVNEGEATYTSGVGYTLPVAGDMNNIGYTFNGWYANSDLSTGGVVTAIGISEYGDKEFWAKWTENTYTITYNANGGSGSTSATEGHYVTVADNGFTAPSGNSFVEWNTADDGSGMSYNEGDEIELTADMTLYAIWAKSVGTINWSVTKIDSKLYRGGGGYTITAEINDASWDATAADASKLELTASDGVVLRNIAKSINASDKAQITANFDITTDVNANATKITFTLSVPENNGYAPAEDDHDEDLDDCGGGIIYAMHMTAYNTCEVNSTYGGSALLGSYSSSSGDNVTANDHTHYKPSGMLLTATLKSGLTFQAGDVVTLYMTSDGSAKTTGYKICKSSGSSTLVQDVTETMNKGTEYAISATLTAAMTTIVGASSIRLDRYNSNVRFYGMEVARSSGGGAVTPTLTWDTDLSGGVAAETGDADFTHTVTQNKNSLGAITYSSSNTSVVTVNATTGKVHIVGGGSATITATIAESGCYDEATASYNITVADNCEDVAGTIGTVDQGCSGIQMTVTGHTAEAGVTYQWYKDGATISGATSDNYTATEPGEYYVEVTNEGEGHCTKASTNTVTLEASEVVTAAKIVNQWYVKNGRRTPDVALVQTENATSFVVKIGDTKIWDSNGSVSDGFGGCPFRLGDDGIIYLNGQTTAGAAPSDLIAGDVTLKITASGCSSTADELSIVIHKQAATTAKSVAFVVDGTKGGAVTAFTEAHATTSPLYVYLDSVGTAASARQFTLTGRNAYWSTVDSTLKAHYSQFDMILITDDPNTQIVPDGVSGKDAYKTKGYINALGCLIDVRPILTMEAFVSALTNWKSKGINGNPTSPNPRQYAMKLDCKDHEIFNGLEEGGNVVPTEEDGTTYWTVTMVDKTKSPYSALATDATDYDGTPALQGFSASDVSSLLLLGEISDGAYYAGVERQEEPAARLMLLGLNAKALPNALTEEGKIIIENALTYLLKTNMEEVDDCSNYFTGATSTDWNTPTNWSKGVVPNSPMVRARILKPCEISGVTAKAAQVDIVTGGTSSKFKGGSGTCTGKLTINPTGALVVGGEIRTAEAPHYNKADLMPTDTNNLVINTNATNQAALIFNNDKGDTKATVNLYSLGRFKDAAYQFQYFAVPMTYLDVNPAFAGAGIYTYVWTEASGWERRAYYKGLEAFEGVGITTTFTEAKTYQMKGTLASTEEREITLTTGGAGAGQNIIGNSWLAPIDIASLRTALDDDASIVDKTIYIYCTGNDGGSVEYGVGETPGQWLAIPIDASGWSGWGELDGLKVIPAMQGFCIIANSETTLTLNYDELVRKRAATMNRDTLTTPLRAPKREAEAEDIELIRIRVADSQTHTDLYLFEGESFSDEFDNGWEAKYMSSDGRSAKLYAETAIGPMAVTAQPEYEGTVLGFAPGKETEYTFTFSGPNKEYYLNDLKEKKSTLISEDESYMFTFEEGDTNRFYISKTPINAPSVATGTENTGDGAKARKVLVNDKLYIILNGRVYSAEGVMVK